MKLSAAIITFNEEQNIGRCIESLKDVADEILVVDSFSTDRTRDICEKAGARFIQHPFEGHIQQKNYALSQCTGEWILSLDADEALDDQLRQSIRAAVSSQSFDGYRMNRLTYYCGHWVRHCGWYPDTKLRLVRKGSAEWRGVNPHDRLDLISGAESGFLRGDILHYSYYTREDHLRQIEYFSGIASKELYQRGRKISVMMMLFKVIAQFLKSYFVKLGFLDGITGWNISRLSAFATWRKYTMLRKLYQNT